jgi:hypothetical protein
MLAPITHVIALTTFHRERLLPRPGRVLVRKGDKVKPLDVIAEVSHSTEHVWLDLAKGLGIAPERVPHVLQVPIGDQVTKGDVLAGPIGFARRVVRSPYSGRLILLRNGQALIQLEGAPLRVRAGIPGKIVSITPEYGATIECSGALVQGVWGNGKVDMGLLRLVASKPDEVLTAERMQIGLRGAVVLAGCCEDLAALQAAAELPVRGLILASMSAALVSSAARMDYPILITEGFGRIPMNSAAFNLLTTNEGREITLNAEPFDRYAATCPEAVIPLPVTQAIAAPSRSCLLQPNRRVRVVRAPYRSKVGTMVSLRPGLVSFPNGLRARAAAVRLEDEKTVILPLANLEILE